MNETLERRLELLKLEGLGLSHIEIVKLLSQKWRKSARAIYYDLETRDTWQPLFNQVFDQEKVRLVVLNRYEYVYREAAFQYDRGIESQKPQYLKNNVRFKRPNS